MKSFLQHIKEEVLPTVQVADGGLDIEKPAVRAAINAAIAGVVSQPAVTPYVVFNRLSKLLAQYHIVLPKKFLEGDKGVEVFEIRQFGHRMGMTDSGEFVNHVPTTHYLFLQYGIITPMGVTYAKPLVGGMFRVTARLVDKVELDRLLDMAEITMSEEAECMQAIAKANAPKEPMQDITDDPKKVGNKKAVATSEKKSIDEELSHGARELTLHADNDQQLHRSSHQPIIKNLQRKHDKGKYDHDKATKLWGYHANRAAKSYEKQHGGKFSVADRKAAASHFADSARSEHGFGSVKEDKDPCWKGYEMIGMKKKGSRKVPNCVPANEENLAELSTAKMAKYIEPAYNSARDLTKEAGYHKANADDAKHHGDRKDYDKHMSRYRKARDKVDNREVGISRAASKIAKRDIKMRKAMGEEALAEKAPPGREKQVLALKKKFPKGSGSPFAIAWSSYNKSKGE